VPNTHRSEEVSDIKKDKVIVEQVLIAFFAKGHVLLEGVPGMGKTLLVKSLSKALGFDFKRIQFTPDLMPADITGTQIVVEKGGGRKEFEFAPGPLFTNILLADEIHGGKTGNCCGKDTRIERTILCYGDSESD